MKRFNRQNELLADDAERVGGRRRRSSAASRIRPTRLREAWTRFLWHQFHDDLTGTCIPQAYQFSWNDEIASLNQFAGVLTLLDERHREPARTPPVTGVPLVVYNPLSMPRHEPVEATVTFRLRAASPAFVAVDDADRRVHARAGPRAARREGAAALRGERAIGRLRGVSRAAGCRPERLKTDAGRR